MIRILAGTARLIGQSIRLGMLLTSHEQRIVAVLLAVFALATAFGRIV